MPKRKAVDNQDNDDDDTALKKHSLDSDEEDDDGKKYEIMNDEDVEGQEETTIDFDGDIKITPFNIREELEEGHFDKDGNYFLNKEEEVKDSWLDNIDWVKVKAREKDVESRGIAESDSDSESNIQPVDQTALIQKMLDLMKPGETVLKAIRRLGNKSGSKSSASSRWLKNKKMESKSNVNSAEGEDETAKMLSLTELADQLLSTGRMEIYSDTYEKLKYELERKNKVESEPLDMFGDEFDESAKEPKAGPSQSSEKTNLKSEKESNEILWEFKWEKTDDAEIYGPHSTVEMQGWVADGYFSDGVWVRRASETDAQFYSSKRIDFELYL